WATIASACAIGSRRAFGSCGLYTTWLRSGSAGASLSPGPARVTSATSLRTRPSWYARIAGPRISAPNGSPEMRRTRGRSVREGELVLDLLERRGGRVALGGDQLVDRHRPLDSYVGILVRDAALELVVVVARLLVEDVRDVAQHAEPVREADRAVDDVEVLVAQLEALP